jgi:hypothetical protein
MHLFAFMIQVNFRLHARIGIALYVVICVHFEHFAASSQPQMFEATNSFTYVKSQSSDSHHEGAFGTELMLLIFIISLAKPHPE